jgi:hypothetical protein
MQLQAYRQLANEEDKPAKAKALLA